MLKVNQEFVNYVCGKNNTIDVSELTAEITKEYGNNVEIKLNKKLPTMMKETDIFSIMKQDFNKWFIEIQGDESLNFEPEKISIEDIELFEGTYLVKGYYDNKYFALDIDIEKNIFCLFYEDTECTDEELKMIFENVKQYCTSENN